ncbi:hypothetical protein ACET3Z_011020 [Daucus carota]
MLLFEAASQCSPFGSVDGFKLLFARLEDARAAESLNGQLEIAGRAIKVSMSGFDDRLVNGGSILELIGQIIDFRHDVGVELLGDGDGDGRASEEKGGGVEVSEKEEGEDGIGCKGGDRGRKG